MRLMIAIQLGKYIWSWGGSTGGMIGCSGTIRRDYVSIGFLRNLRRLDDDDSGGSVGDMHGGSAVEWMYALKVEPRQEFLSLCVSS
jgi:hypothetical protein